MVTTTADYERARSGSLEKVKLAIANYENLRNSYRHNTNVAHAMDHAKIEALEAALEWRDLFTVATGPIYEEGMKLIREKLFGDIR